MGSVVVCGVVCGSLWWSVVVCGSLWWSVVFSASLLKGVCSQKKESASFLLSVDPFASLAANSFL